MAHENLGKESAEKARQAYSDALGQQPPYPDALWVLKGLANAFRLGEISDTARHKYEEVINQASERSEEIGANGFSLLAGAITNSATMTKRCASSMQRSLCSRTTFRPGSIWPSVWLVVGALPWPCNSIGIRLKT